MEILKDFRDVVAVDISVFFLGMYPEISGYFGGWRKFLGYPMWSKSPKYAEKRVQKHSDLHLDSKNSVWPRLRRAKGENEQKTRF